MECEELGCVVGGPFKPNKLREVRGLVWRPWINKPSEMTMRCADICHHTAPASKHKPPKPSLPCPVSHMVPPPPTIHLSHSLSSPFIHFISTTIPLFLIFYLTPSFFPLFHLLLYSCSSSYLLPLSPFLHFMSPQ